MISVNKCFLSLITLSMSRGGRQVPDATDHSQHLLRGPGQVDTAERDERWKYLLIIYTDAKLHGTIGRSRLYYWLLACKYTLWNTGRDRVMSKVDDISGKWEGNNIRHIQSVFDLSRIVLKCGGLKVKVIFGDPKQLKFLEFKSLWWCLIRHLHIAITPWRQNSPGICNRIKWMVD